MNDNYIYRCETTNFLDRQKLITIDVISPNWYTLLKAALHHDSEKLSLVDKKQNLDIYNSLCDISKASDGLTGIDFELHVIKGKVELKSISYDTKAKRDEKGRLERQIKELDKPELSTSIYVYLKLVIGLVMPHFFENLMPYYEKYSDPDSVILRGVNSLIELAFHLNLPIILSKFGQIDLCGHYCKAITPAMLVYMNKLSKRGSPVLEGLLPQQLVSGLLVKNPYGNIGIIRGEFAVSRFNRDRDVRIMVSSIKSSQDVEFIADGVSFGNLIPVSPLVATPLPQRSNSIIASSALPELNSHIDTSFTPVSRGNTPGRLGDKLIKELPF